MSRVKSIHFLINDKNSQTMLKRIEVSKKVKKSFVSTFLSINNVRSVVKILIETLYPLIYAMFLIFLSIGVMYIYGIKNSESGLVELNYDRITEFKHNEKTEILSITDNSQKEKSLLEKEVARLRSKTISLEVALFKVNALLRNTAIRYQFEKELPDFASEAAGGSVIATPDTQPFYEPINKYISFFGIPLCKPDHFTPRKVIQPWTEAGECWAFRGWHGKIEIELSHEVKITHVTLEHIPIELSLTGRLDPAPKYFAIYGKFRNKYLPLGMFVYNIEGLPSQKFSITKNDIKELPFKQVMLEVLSNWGNPQYTCIYRFKVHGKIY